MAAFVTVDERFKYIFHHTVKKIKPDT